jgi:hypothetical protein
MLNSFTQTNTTTTTNNNKKKKIFSNLIAHKLAHSIRNEDSEQFLYLYDKIPSFLEQSLVNEEKKISKF